MHNTPLIVLLQIFLIWAVAIWVYYLAARRDGRAPIDDIGFLWLGVFALYATLPPLSWLLQGGSYGPLSGRLFQLQPSNKEVVYLLCIALAYIIAFASVYIVLLRRVSRPVATALARIRGTKMAGAVMVVLAASLIGVVIGASGLIRPVESYGDSYLVIAELPLGLRQLIKIVGAFSSVAALVLIVAVLQRWPRYRLLFICYLFSILFSINPEGGRSEVATGLLGIVIAWHVLVRPIPSGRLLAGGVFGLVVFLLLGIWRGFGSLTGIGEIGLDGVGVGEFDSLWANAVELWQAKQSGGVDVPFETRFGELFALVPSQLLWFEKSSLSIWYLDTFHPIYKEAGGGLAFGAISQAVIGGGMFEAAIRGAIIGALAGWIMKWVRTPTTAWWRFPLHLYMLIWIFQGIRDTTFSLWGAIVQTVLPAIIVIAIIGELLTSRTVPNHRISDAC